ncbi:DUF732 domain-containing protein [Mycobacterium montefiorense]|uniref:DUF732 domain-containing protein n=1 Tax=Mycobacterium montefiorense TaxID=154654 RepID=A0AA37PRP0_9MYCO|nr:DUF732 domain-containing protein [Mycobacterium montefiorense]MCV7427600.1 DUF732 domain-containing protein [Mycobacterium montefiorense]GBG36575.1 hypothetical protein MmonteBS_09470 [Mycobacterium montefiorense]GKU36924.1 hypothetical protein NJB14191_42700 [Mycobacterium montefiorense]GKU43170.1 hypothetical protein NJB14192_51530 [Mycobacterium montefiorense]GKU48519.1 hypothetical protein NJB14194_51340 [Mycobacterium montefiorense]
MRGILLLLASFTAVVALAVPAQADPSPDAKFLAALTKAGITYQTPSVAISVGKRECALMDQGMPEGDVIRTVSESNPAFKGNAAVEFTTIAEDAYCPQHEGESAAQPAPPPA